MTNDKRAEEFIQLNGRDSYGRFMKGNSAWCKGTKGIMKPNKTSFKKGMKPWIAGKHHTKEEIIKAVETRRKNGSYKKGKENPLFKGNKKLRKDGYIEVYCEKHPYAIQNYILEHRLVMEQHMGRILFPYETVHHINEIKNDNRIDNLMLFPTKAAHVKYHSKIGK